MKKNKEWWQDFFDDFAPAFDLVPAKIVNQDVRFFIKKLKLSKGKSFLDCPCGIGRISIPMAKRGIRVTGVDFMQPYLDILADRTIKAGVKITTVRRDMRRIQYTNQFDAAGNIWTSLGYFQKESDNFLVVKNLYRALKPGGRVLFHMINRDYVIANFRPHIWEQVSGMYILNDNSFDFQTSRGDTNWLFIKDGQEKRLHSDLRIYSYHELYAMMRKAGFVDIEGFSSVKEEPISQQNRMMFVFGTKPKSR
ncbi:MAG: methyltransferase domain-containing protein [Candidatus Zixiibacteriota bacterium]